MRKLQKRNNYINETIESFGCDCSLTGNCMDTCISDYPNDDLTNNEVSDTRVS